jgi:hypothetical protein
VSRSRPWDCSWISAVASELKRSRSHPARRSRCAMYSAVSPGPPPLHLRRPCAGAPPPAACLRRDR